MTTRAPTSTLFTFRMVPLIAGMLAQHGIDAAELVREAGLPPEALRGEVTAPLIRVQKLLELLATKLRAPLFGLDLAERVPSGAFGVVEFVMRSAPSVERALAVLCELSALINPLIDFRFTVDDHEGRLNWAIPAQRDALGMHLNEYTLGLLVKQVGAVLGEPLPLERAWFAHTRRDHVDDVAARFRCPVAFQAADCGFAIPREVLTRRPRTADEPLFEFLCNQARAQVAQLGSADVVTQVMRVIEMRMPNGDVSTAAIAKAMATTVRSLQRHLADAGTSFRDVLAHVRMRRRAELARGGLSETEIAHRLGFADARSMRRSLDEPSTEAEAEPEPEPEPPDAA